MAARCGEKLVAAQGGTVVVNAYQAGGAGYYVVIRGVISGTDYVYMHMKRPSWTTAGTVVYTGQGIGKVGNTGASSGCHLHFEHWTAPGWYQGGSPYDPLPELTTWDALLVGSSQRLRFFFFFFFLPFFAFFSQTRGGAGAADATEGGREGRAAARGDVVGLGAAVRPEARRRRSSRPSSGARGR